MSQAAIQLTLTATMLGFALGQLLVGPWSDRIGRRLPLIIATSVHVTAWSLGIFVAVRFEMLFAFRILQGAGAAAGGVVAMAIVRDLFGGLPLVRMLSRLSLVNGLAPILAPVIGSQLLRLMPWRGIFLFLAIYGVLVVLAAIFFIVETLPAERRALLPHSTIGSRYRSLFGDRIFVGVAIMAGMTFSGLFAYLSSSSFLFQDVYGLDAQQFGLLFAVNSVGVVAGVQVSSFVARFVGPQWILVGAVSGMILSASTIVVLGLLDAGIVGILCRCGSSSSRADSLSLARRCSHLRVTGVEAATAASLLGALNFGTRGPRLAHRGIVRYRRRNPHGSHHGDHRSRLGCRARSRGAAAHRARAHALRYRGAMTRTRRLALAGGITALAAVLLLGGLTVLRGTPFGIDSSWMSEITEHRSELWLVPSLVMNFIGGGWFAIWVVPLGGALLLFLVGRRWAALYFVLVALSAGIVQLLGRRSSAGRGPRYPRSRGSRIVPVGTRRQRRDCCGCPRSHIPAHLAVGARGRLDRAHGAVPHLPRCALGERHRRWRGSGGRSRGADRGRCLCGRASIPFRPRSLAPGPMGRILRIWADGTYRPGGTVES